MLSIVIYRYSVNYLTKNHCASRELLCVRLEASSELVLHSLNQHFLTVYNVDTWFNDLCNATT